MRRANVLRVAVMTLMSLLKRIINCITLELTVKGN